MKFGRIRTSAGGNNVDNYKRYGSIEKAFEAGTPKPTKTGSSLVIDDELRGLVFQKNCLILNNKELVLVG